jgi:ATP-dependent Zn protease
MGFHRKILNKQTTTNQTNKQTKPEQTNKNKQQKKNKNNTRKKQNTNKKRKKQNNIEKISVFFVFFLVFVFVWGFFLSSCFFG